MVDKAVDEDYLIPSEVDAVAFEKLNEFEKKFYKEDNGKFKLRVKYEDNDDLVNAKQRETNRAKKLELEKKDLEQQLKLIQKAKKNDEEKVEGDKSTLQTQIDDLKKQLADTDAKSKAKIEKAVIEKTAIEVASLFKSKKAGEAFAKSRLAVEEDENGDIRIVFLDDNGRKTSMNFEQFKKNLVADEDLKGILLGVDSSGGGATGTKKTAVPTVSFDKMSIEDRLSLYKADPVLFSKLEAEHKSKLNIN